MIKKALTIALYATIMVHGMVYASPPTRSYNYSTGGTILSSQVNTNELSLYTYLQNGVDTYSAGTIYDTSIASSANIQYSKLNLSGQIKSADIASSGIDGTKLSGLANITAGAGVIPVANLPSTGVASDGTTGLINLLQNGDMETWTAGTSVAPDGWTLTGAGYSISRDAVTFKRGIYSAKITRSGTDCNLTAYAPAGATTSDRAGASLTLSAWVWASVANSARLTMGTSNGSYHPGDSAWHYLTVTGVVTAAVGGYNIAYLSVNNNNTSAYFDGVSVVEGSSPFAFTPSPLDSGRTSFYSSGSGTWTSPAGVSVVYVSGCGGGGGGGGSFNGGFLGGGGSAGAKLIQYPFVVTPSTGYSYAVGALGAGGASQNNGTTGGSTTFSTITLTGGNSGYYNSPGTGASGASVVIGGVTFSTSAAGGNASGSTGGAGAISMETTLVTIGGVGKGGTASTGAGGNASGYCAGGAGAGNTGSNAGGNGANGYLLLQW